MEAGIFYVVATPIGHLDDISRRALQVLGQVDLILAEDTRHSLPMLRRYGVRTPLQALHEHNEQRMVSRVIKRLEVGENIALISDAGTPLISDPGYPLVRALRERGLTVVPIPGPSALICALSAAGVPTDRFVFEGFLPSKRQQRRRRLQSLAREPRTLVFFEAPHRVLAIFEDMAVVFGNDRRGVLARELTKTFETFRQGTLSELHAWLQANPEQRKGEFVILVEGAGETIAPAVVLRSEEVLQALLPVLPVKRAVAIAAQLTGEKRNLLYQHALKLTKEG
jgi:16S rRNA (cytidine1402-2'-O)-methyltransferase